MSEDLNERIADLEARLEALQRDAASMWRAGVSDTIAIIDRERRSFAPALRFKRNSALASADAEINIALDAWYRFTRRHKPVDYDDAERLFRLFFTSPIANPDASTPYESR